ncbi:glycosyltransferase [Salinisphaera sp. Q1T1-3]|uniref:glycosyltransferase n=1 Tax=Salinisphaera sp. Q1T1-3 TaxID=2321229 RepID=UPI001314222C|nr:glycosyltransferase [Salinisphaera sp. Q1T1-3]
MNRPIRIAHYVSLSGFGGVEQQFSAFAVRAARRAGVSQTAVACSREIHPHHAEALSQLDDWAFEKKWRGWTIPKRPRAWRRRWARHLVGTQQPDVALLWNRLGQQARAIELIGARRALYWEHGSAWLFGEDEAKRAALARMPAVIANSVAARRMLQLRWDYDGPVRVIPNGVRAPVANTSRTLLSDRPIRLGVAGRLIPIKGVVLALHTLARLTEQGVSATLSIAGDGPLRARLAAQAEQLGVQTRVHFAGVVDDMPGFFAGIDLLIHPALREPFGMVAAEAQAAGVPVVCSAVDGLPEVVADDVSGLCVPPVSDLTRHRALGGDNDGLPPVVYQPTTDRVAAPLICEPADLAGAVAALAGDPTRYHAMSEAALARMRAGFGFETHVEGVLAAAREYAETGTLNVS